LASINICAMQHTKHSLKEEPISKIFSYLSRLFLARISKKLRSLDIDRYYYTLILVKEGGGKITQSELSQRIGTDKVFTVKILDYLTDKKLLTREINEKDRRQHFISLTEKGEQMIPEILLAYRQTMKEVLNGVKKEEIEIFYKVLEAMHTNMQVLAVAEDEDELKQNNKSKK
jgi:DNA-binding MarR family transcriptional regulator